MPVSPLVRRRRSLPLLLTKSGVVAPSSLLTGLVSYWTLDEASGTRVDSVVTSGNDLTDNNTVTQAVGKVGNAGQFTRANSEFLSRLSNASLQMGDRDRTLAAWVYINSTNTMSICGKDGNVAGQREFGWEYNAGANRLRFYVFRATDSAVVVNADNFGVVSTHLNEYLCVIAQHNAATDIISIRVNNGTPNTAATGGALQPASNGQFRVGTTGYPGFEQYFDGRIDELGDWNRVLTDAECATYFNAGAGITYPFTGT